MLMRFMLMSALVVADMLVAIPAHSQFSTGNDLYANCSTKQGQFNYDTEWGLCLGYIVGVADTMTQFQQLNKIDTCVPSPVTKGQLRAMVIKYMEDHPEKRAYPASAIVLLTMQTGFGCVFPTRP